MRTFHGKVVQVRNAPITVQKRSELTTPVIGVSNPDLKLKPGMTANVSNCRRAKRTTIGDSKTRPLRYYPGRK